MIQITSEQLSKIMPTAKGLVDTYLPYINKYAVQFGINTRNRMSYFLATVAIESGEMRHTVENLNYSSKGLVKTFPKYFNVCNAERYAKNPQMIANKVYANRMGNGNESSGDGWKYRGRGFIQLTGKDNYFEYNKYLINTGMRVDLLSNPDLIAQPLGAVKSAMWFWQKRGCNELADKDEASSIRRKINGGLNGFTQFALYYQRAKLVLR